MRKSPWDPTIAPPPARREVTLELPTLGTLRLRSLSRLEGLQVQDRALELIGTYLTGEGREGGQPALVVTPTIPPEVIPMSRQLLSAVALLEVMEQPVEGEPRWGLVDWAGAALNCPDDWEMVRSAVVELQTPPTPTPEERLGNGHEGTKDPAAGTSISSPSPELAATSS